MQNTTADSVEGMDGAGSRSVLQKGFPMVVVSGWWSCLTAREGNLVSQGTEVSKDFYPGFSFP